MVWYKCKSIAVDGDNEYQRLTWKERKWMIGLTRLIQNMNNLFENDTHFFYFIFGFFTIIAHFSPSL